MPSVTKEELDGIRLIQNKLDCTSQMLKLIPEGIDPITMKMYIDGVIEARSAVLFLQNEWWNNVIRKYGVGSKSTVDFSTGELT